MTAPLNLGFIRDEFPDLSWSESIVATTKMLQALRYISENRGLDTSTIDQMLDEIEAAAERQYDTLVKSLVEQGIIPPSEDGPPSPAD